MIRRPPRSTQSRSSAASDVYKRQGDYRVVNAQEVYSVPHLRRVADRHRVPLVLTLHGYPLYESVSEGYTGGSDCCLLYTSDAADDLLCVDLGGRRIIKKKKKK